jgi:hypothetical protein
MEVLTPFAQVAVTPEPIIAQVRRQLGDDPQHGMKVPTSELDRVAGDAVRQLWGSRVKTFVPILALRQAREVLCAQDVVLSAPGAEPRQIDGAPAAGRSRAERPVWDRLGVDDDVLPLGDHDVLSFEDRDALPL